MREDATPDAEELDAWSAEGEEDAKDASSSESRGAVRTLDDIVCFVARSMGSWRSSSCGEPRGDVLRQSEFEFSKSSS